ncbi:hypothetical protein D3C84_1192650 [compost metagenome]
MLAVPIEPDDHVEFSEILGWIVLGALQRNAQQPSGLEVPVAFGSTTRRNTGLTQPVGDRAVDEMVTSRKELAQHL